MNAIKSTKWRNYYAAEGIPTPLQFLYCPYEPERRQDGVQPSLAQFDLMSRDPETPLHQTKQSHDLNKHVCLSSRPFFLILIKRSGVGHGER